MNPRSVDQAYEAEADVAAHLGLEYTLIDYEALVNEGNAQRAVRRVPELSESVTGIYRGWMLKPSDYRLLFEALAAKGIRLINDPTAYQHCHYLPESYSVIEGCTPKTVWMQVHGDVSMDAVMELLRPLGTGPVIVKDFVKSRKHEWEEACFIPSAADRATVERVVKRFIELQDDDFREGLVFREFVELKPLVRHSKSGMPLTLEFRAFVLNGRPVYWTEYWEEGDYHGIQPPLESFRARIEQVKSRFFTVDLAKTKAGEWIIIELGDGQVAGLPENAAPEEFYSALRESVAGQRYDDKGDRSGDQAD